MLKRVLHLLVGMGLLAGMLNAHPVQADAVAAGAQPMLETGAPLLRTFSPKEYGAQPQNWAIVQDPRGVIYVGNSSGVLEFDGLRWRLIPVANGTAARSLAVDANGRIYVGAIGEIGYLQADASGQPHYVSLRDRLQPDERDFADVFQTFVTPHGVVFSSFQRLLRIRDSSVESWTPSQAFHFAFLVNDRVFVREVGRGLLELVDGDLQLLPAGERFADEKIYAMLPSQGSTSNQPALLVGTRSQGLMRFDGSSWSAWPTDVDVALKRDLLYDATRLPDGRLALGTIQGGLYLLDMQGRLNSHLGKADGLPDDGVLDQLIDREGGLWLGLDRGIARLQVDDPLSHFDEHRGLGGAVTAVFRHQGRLYAGTAQGLHALAPGPTAEFRHIPGVEGQTWAFLPTAAGLLVGNYQGVYAVSGERAELILEADQAFSLAASRMAPGSVYVGSRGSVTLLRWVEGKWQQHDRISGLDDEVRTLWEDHDGRVWAGMRSSGVLRLQFSGPNAESVQVERFGPHDGLPDLNTNAVYSIDGEPRFATLAGIYRATGTPLRFEPDPGFTNLFAEPRAVSGLHQQPGRGVWMFARDPRSGLDQAGLAEPAPDGSYRWRSEPLRALQGVSTDAMQRIHHDADDVLWIGSAEGLFRYDAGIAKNYQLPFPALLRLLHSQRGPVAFETAGGVPALALDYGQNALRFDYAAPYFDGLQATRFQSWLEGNDAGWSAWTTESYRDYSHLFEGDYRFRVRARNLYGGLSTEAVIAFSVRPPWYRSAWAYAGYALLLAVGGRGALRWRFRRLQGQKRALEAKVTERTQQLAALGEVGRAITAELDLDAALDTLYLQLNRMLDAGVFGIGLYDATRGEIDFRLAIENGQRYQPYVRRMDERNQLAVWCIEQQRSILIGDFPREYSRYLAEPDDLTGPLADGSLSRSPLSAMYVPLWLKGQVIGVLGVQSFVAHAYEQGDLDLLQSLAAYAATAIDNAKAHAALARSHSDLAHSHEQLHSTHQRLISTQQQLVLQEKMASLGTLTAGVAHEINNPTNFIAGSAQNLEAQLSAFRAFLQVLAGEDAEPEVLAAFDQQLAPQHAEVRNILRGTQRISAIIHDLQQFSRLDEAERKTVPIAEPIQSVLSLIHTRFAAIDFVLDLAPNPSIECQPAKLAQAFMSIIVNACEAISRCTDGRSGQLRVALCTRTEGDSSMLEIHIDDNGCGMSAAIRSRIFEPFFTTKEVGSGSGLGLSIAFGIVQEHGGRIEVESTPGRGSRFSVLLPR